jgi:hypothetical protein
MMTLSVSFSLLRALIGEQDVWRGSDGGAVCYYRINGGGSLQGFWSIATNLFVVISIKLLQYAPTATKWRSLPPVATGRMVIGYRHKKLIVAIKCVIATVLW